MHVLYLVVVLNSCFAGLFHASASISFAKYVFPLTCILLEIKHLISLSNRDIGDLNFSEHYGDACFFLM